MVNLYSLVKNHNDFRKLEVNGLLLVEYTCMIEATRFGIWSNNNYFAYITSGRKIWKSLFHDYEVQQGDILFIKKGANLTHQFFEDGFCAIFLFIPDDFIKSFLQKYPDFLRTPQAKFPVQDSVLRVSPDELLESYFSSVASYLFLSKKPNEQLLTLKFEELLINICSNDRYRQLQDYFVSLCQNQAHLIRSVMEANFAYNLKIGDFAKLCNLSLSSFKRSFMKLYNTTPAAWLRERKLELALKYLLTTNTDIGQISFQCGFEDTSHFIRVFKGKYKTTPHQYRLQQGKYSIAP